MPLPEISIHIMLHFIMGQAIRIWAIGISIHHMLHFIGFNFMENGQIGAISIHHMLHFIGHTIRSCYTRRKFQYIICYTSFLVNTRFLSHETFTFYHINQHFTTLFTNLFYIFFTTAVYIQKSSHLSINFLHFSSSPVGKNQVHIKKGEM